MVKLYKFYCDACGYEAIVSGQNGRDEINSGLTIHCEDCKELYEIEDQGSYTIKQKAFYKKARCPESFTHQFRIWTDPGVCPKCGKPMRKGDLVVSWD
jgi:hypothetical protein